MSKPSKKINLKMPTVEEDQLITAAAESDPDALPLTDEQIERTAFTGKSALRRKHRVLRKGLSANT
jgi:hypothetical protein